MTILLFHYPAPSADAALQNALIEAKLRQSTLLIAGVTSSDSHADNHAISQEDLDRLARGAHADGVTAETELIVSSDAAEAIIDLSNTRDVELLVIGLRKRSPVGKLFLGSIAQQLLLGTQCPVLAVKAEMEAN